MIHDDIRSLMEALNELASQFLIELDTFPPSGAAIDKNGELSLIKAYESDGCDEPDEQIELLEATFRHDVKKGLVRACAMAVDVTVEDPRTGKEVDAILVSAEVQSGQAMHVFTPYKITDKVELAKPFAERREPQFF